MATQAKSKQRSKVQLPAAHDWRTTDEDEINRRRLRAEEDPPNIVNVNPDFRIFSNFKVTSSSGLTYQVEIRDIHHRHFCCNCVDFRINGLGTCKHVEAVLLYLEARYRRLFRKAVKEGSSRIDVVADPVNETLRIERGRRALPPRIRKWFDREGLLQEGSPETVAHSLKKLSHPELRLSQEIDPWLKRRYHEIERHQLRHEYEQKVQSGEWPIQETKVPLFPYQREGMLHLAFTERALLADEMGLGKTIQAIAASALLQRLGKANRVLIITPTSLKAEWEEQIRKFTSLPLQLVYGSKTARLKAYQAPPFFTITNYEQMLADSLDVNQRLQPDIVILDEAQRIKNWNTKTAQAIKRLHSRYAFVLTGTPIENRLDELYSLMDFLNPNLLGPLFRFNRDFYQLDDRGKPKGYKNLDQLHYRIKPYLLRRRKTDVETELPDRTVHTYFVSLSNAQKEPYQQYAHEVMKLCHIAKRRPLTKKEQDRLMVSLAKMRMLCDTPYILDTTDRTCPKLSELQKILEECQENPETKVIVFSEWERMLSLVRELCDQLGLGYAWHTGSVPQRKRRREIQAFKQDPDCRVFLSTDSGSTGLNLENASFVINCDLPWNPAKLEQRIARAWRKNQSQPVTVIHLVSQNTIEHRMLATLSDKQALADSVLDQKGDLKELTFRSGRQAFLEKLQQLVSTEIPDSDKSARQSRTAPPVDPAQAFAEQAARRFHNVLSRIEERYPTDGVHTVLLVVVDGDADLWRPTLESLHQECVGPNGSESPYNPQLEVLDKKSLNTMERLVEAGVMAPSFRAKRPLFPESERQGAQASLTPEEKQKGEEYRQEAKRQWQMGSLLGQGGFQGEAHHTLSNALLSLGSALAVEHRFPEPKELADLATGPLRPFWIGDLANLQRLADKTTDWKLLNELLEKQLAEKSTQNAPATAADF